MPKTLQWIYLWSDSMRLNQMRHIYQFSAVFLNKKLKNNKRYDFYVTEVKTIESKLKESKWISHNLFNSLRSFFFTTHIRQIFFSVSMRFEYKNMLDFLLVVEKNEFFISSADTRRKSEGVSKQNQLFLCLELITFFQVQ